MVFDIIAYLIIALAFGAFSWNIFRFFVRVPGKTNSMSPKCAGCSSGCSTAHATPIKKYKLDPKNYYQLKL